MEKLDTTIKRADLKLKEYEIQKQKESIELEKDEITIRKIDCLSWLLQGAMTVESLYEKDSTEASVAPLLDAQDRAIIQDKIMDLVKTL